MNIFSSLPFNRRRKFVMATAPGGCEIYIPVDSDDMRILLAWKKILAEELQKMAQAPTPPEPPKAA